MAMASYPPRNFTPTVLHLRPEKAKEAAAARRVLRRPLPMSNDSGTKDQTEEKSK
jgi:hypothetical protein